MQVSRVSAVSSVALIFAMSATIPAWAQSAGTTETDESRQETVIVTGTTGSFGATKNETPIVETARSLSVETADMFIDKGALRLADTLTYVAGVTAEPYGFSTRGDFPFSRGLSIPRYRDSIQELFGSYNSTRTDVYTIEQVEVLKGPASVLYGQGSPGGIVNYVSKTPRDEFGGNEKDKAKTQPQDEGGQIVFERSRGRPAHFDTNCTSRAFTFVRAWARWET